MADIQKLKLNVDGVNTTYDISATWSKVTGKPSTFPAEAHTHPYLPLSGGTLASSSSVVLGLDTTNSEQNAFVLYHKGVMKTQLGYVVNEGSYIYDYSTRTYLGIDTNGVAYCGSAGVSSNNHHLLIHSGNISDYSIGSATKLQDNTTFTAWGQTFFENGKPKNVRGEALIGAVLIGRGNNVIDGWSQGSGADLYLNYNSTKNIRACYNGGNVIIGSTSDNGNKLQVNGSANFVDSISLYEKNEATRLTQYVYQNIGRIYAYNDTESKYKDLWVGNNSGTALIIKSNGNVLIGTTTDSGAKLRVSSTRTESSPTAFSWSLGSLADNSELALEYSATYGLYTAIQNRSGNVAMQVGRSDGDTSAYNLLLQPLGGNVLIGTTTDISWADLNVNGPIVTKDYVSFYRNGEKGYVGCGTESTDDVYLSASTNNLRLFSKGFTAIRGGNVVIGKETESSYGYKLDIYQDTNKDYDFHVFNNATKSSFFVGKSALWYGTSLTGDAHIFNIASGCTYDGGGGTSVLSAKANGNVLIGTTEDDGHKLRVNGRIKGTGYHLDNTSAAYCGLMPNSMITTSGDSKDIWLYNDHKVSLYGSEIHFNATTKCNGNLITSSLNGYTPITSGNIATQSVSYANSSGYSNRLLSPYTYEDGTYISNDTSAESIFGSSYAFSAMMDNCTIFNDFATVFNFSGYKQWGATQLAVDYNNLTPRMALRNYHQSISGWTDWVEFITSANIASQSVTYATNATKLYANDSYAYGGSNPYYLQMRYNVLGDNSWYLSVYPESPANVSVDRARKLVTSRGIFGNSFDGTSDIPVTAVGHMRYLLFKDAAGTTNVGYIGRGGSTNAMELQTYGNYPLLLGAYSKNILTLAPSGNVIIGSTTDYSQKLQINGNIRFIAAADCEIGNAYSLTDTNAYNRIIIGNSSTGIKYCSGRWTSGNVIAHTFCVGTQDNSAVTINNNGYLGVNINSASYSLDVAGDIRTHSIGIDNEDGTGRGISLYRAPNYVDMYGIHFSVTSKFGTHGSVTGNWATYFTTSDNYYGWIFRNSATANVASISGAGNLTCNGSGTFGSNVAVTGKVSASSGFYQESDERLKTFHDPIKVDLDKLKLLRKNYFKFHDRDKLEIGVSAQEIQAIYPEIVSESENGYLSVAYDKLSVIALSAIDELDDKILKLADKISTLENIINKLMGEKGIN